MPAPRRTRKRRGGMESSCSACRDRSQTKCPRRKARRSNRGVRRRRCGIEEEPRIRHDHHRDIGAQRPLAELTIADHDEWKNDDEDVERAVDEHPERLQRPGAIDCEHRECPGRPRNTNPMTKDIGASATAAPASSERNTTAVSNAGSAARKYRPPGARPCRHRLRVTLAECRSCPGSSSYAACCTPRSRRRFRRVDPFRTCIPFPPRFAARLTGHTALAVQRRAKYLLVHCHQVKRCWCTWG